MVDPQRTQHGRFHCRKLCRVFPVEAHRFAQGDWRIGDEPAVLDDVLGGRVEHVGMHENHVTEVSSEFYKLVALPDEGAEIELRWQDALSVVSQEACDYPDRVRRNKGTAALVAHVGPE